MTAADFDGDGDTDVAAAVEGNSSDALYGDCVIWWKNRNASRLCTCRFCWVSLRSTQPTYSLFQVNPCSSTIHILRTSCTCLSCSRPKARLLTRVPSP
ncbi:hypothetical protein ACFL1X_07175 [Candidatus Hydrogenedentota bacterium]